MKFLILSEYGSWITEADDFVEAAYNLGKNKHIAEAIVKLPVEVEDDNT